jgi:hypothetical protein
MGVLGKLGHGEASGLATFPQGHVPVRGGVAALHIRDTVQGSEAMRL